MRTVREAAKESAKGNEAAKEAAIDKEVRLGRDREETSEGLKGRTARTAQELPRQVEETDQAMSKRGKEWARIMEQANGHSARRDREVTRQDVAKQGDSMMLRQRAIKEAEAREREIRAKEVKEKEAMEREAAEACAELAKARAEMEKAKADAIESVSNKFNTDSFEERANARSEGHRTVGPSPDPVIPMNKPQPSADVKIHNDVKYVRQERGPFAGKLVGEKGELLTIDGENYVECRILMRMEF